MDQRERAAQSIERRAAQWATEAPSATPASIDINAELRNEATAIRALSTEADREWLPKPEAEIRAEEVRNALDIADHSSRGGILVTLTERLAELSKESET